MQQKPGGFFAWPVKLTSKLIYLANHVQSSDYQPTEQAREAYVVLKELLLVAHADYRRLVGVELAEFNERLRERGLEEIVVEELEALVP